MSKQNIGYIDLQFSIINLQFTETQCQQMIQIIMFEKLHLNEKY